MEYEDIDPKVLTDIAKKAGAEILKIRKSNELGVEYKDDESPLTLADRASNEVIVGGLKEAFPDVPVMSEESREVPCEERSAWGEYWLVDPLDGTKEFVKNLSEYTVNIALIQAGRPVLGVVHIPELGETFYGTLAQGAFKNNEQVETVGPITAGPVRIAVSRSHASPALESYIASLENEFGEVETVVTGSSLKLCRIAEGAIDIYPRLSPTMEWDIAAGQAVLEASGGRVIDLNSGLPMTYNRRNLRNNSFVAYGW